MLELVKLAFLRLRSPDDYRAMQRHIAEATIAELKVRGVDFSQSRVLELGAGFGGYSLPLHRASKSFVASDLKKDEFFDQTDVHFEYVDVLRPFPFDSCTFDFIYCSSLIEHVAEPATLLSESWRVLRPKGNLFLSFPPFFSLAMVGGHQFKPFHFLGERAAIRLTNLFRRDNFRDYARSFGHGLYPLRIDQVKDLILENGFEILEIYTRMSAINTARWPGILKDLSTWHVCYLARKPKATT